MSVPTTLDPLEVQQLLVASLRASVSKPIKTLDEAQTLLRQCETLRRPTETEWLAETLSAVLSFYPQLGDDPWAVARAKIWKDALGGYPEWAVKEACDWWLGKDNPDRKWPPKPGDIEAKAAKAVALVDFTRAKAMRGPLEPPERTGRPITDAQRAELAAVLAGLRARRNRELGERND